MTYPPEPWTLAGRMDVSTFLVPRAALPATPWPAGHRPLSVAGSVPVGAAWVDYAEGGMLAYRELLVAVATRQGATVRPHIVAIWVDSRASRDGGRELWGIPKELATFDATGDAGAREDLACTPEDAAAPVARAVVRRRRPLIPGRWPVAFTVAQHRGPGDEAQRSSTSGPADEAQRSSTVSPTSALVSPVSTRAGVGLDVVGWEFDADGELGFLAGRRPVFSAGLHDFAMLFGMTPTDRART